METVVPKIRRALYKDMFLIAKQHANLSKQARNSEGEIRHSLIAVIMACCSLEAFINTYAMQKHWNEWGTKEGKRYEYKPMRKKWLDTTQEYSIDGATFNEQSQPYSDFSRLVELRDSLVHYKVKPTSPVQSRKGLISEQEAELTASKAQWAVETAKRMMKEFHRFAGMPFLDWLEF